MKKDAIISISGIQQQPYGESDITTFVTEGYYYRRGGKYYLTYNESELTGLTGTKTTVKVDGDSLSIMRTGMYPSHLFFEKGKRHHSQYRTDFGDLLLAVSTERFSAELNDDGGNVSVKYAIEIDNAQIGTNDFNIKITTQKDTQ